MLYSPTQPFGTTGAIVLNSQLFSTVTTFFAGQGITGESYSPTLHLVSMLQEISPSCHPTLIFQ